MIETLAGALFNKLLTAGLARGGSLAFNKIVRLQKVDSSIRGKKQKNGLRDTVIDDFERVIGTYRGELTQPIQNFLEELQRSNLISAIIDSVLLGKDPAELRNAFYKLHEQIIGKDKGEPADLYGKLRASFTASLETLFRDKALKAYLKASHQDLISRLEKIEDGLASVAPTFPKKNQSYEALNESLLKLSQGLQRAYKDIRIETNKGARPVEISKIFIPSKLCFRKPSKLNVQPAAFEGRPDLYRTEAGRLTFGELKFGFRRVVVLGDPGGGKSTLCQQVCYDFAKQSSFALQHGRRATVDPQALKIPFRIILRFYERALVSDPQLDLLTYICRDLMNWVTGDAEELEGIVKYVCTTGRAIFAFDGLDEILDTSQRRRFVDMVTAFCDRFPLCPVLITSRVVGYDDASLNADFEELLLEKFDPPEVTAYVENFMKVVANSKRDEARATAREFIKQTNQNADDLRRNPLMLGLMAWLFYSKGDVPSNRPEIYHECAMLMFEKWDKHRGIGPLIPNDFDLLHLFNVIAAEIYGKPELAEGVEDKWLRETVVNFFENFYDDKSKAIAVGRSLVEFIVGRAWIMSEVGDKVFAFTHRTFLEYFFARNVDEGCDSVQDLFVIIEPRILRKEWDVVTHLALQLKTHRNIRRTGQALEILINLIDRCQSSPKKLAASIAFAARALEYLPGAEAAVKALVDKIVVNSLAIMTPTNLEVVSDLARVCSCVKERRQIVEAKISEVLAANLNDVNGSNFIAAASLIGRPLGQSDISSGQIIGEALPKKVRLEARSKSKNVIVAASDQNLLVARLKWEWFGDLSVLERQGANLFLHDERFGARQGFNPFAMLALLQAERYRTDGWLGDLEEEYVIQAVKLLGKIGFAMGPYNYEARRFKSLNALPESIWSYLLNKNRSNTDIILGILFCLMMSVEMSIGSDYQKENEYSYLSSFGSYKSSTLHRKIMGIVSKNKKGRLAEIKIFYENWVEKRHTLLKAS